MIETERFIVRKFTSEDADCLHHILSDPDVMKYIEPPYSFEKTVDFIHNAGIRDVPLVWALVQKSTHDVIGQVIFHPYDNNHYEIGWIIAKPMWNNGAASEVTQSLIQYAKCHQIPGLIIECSEDQQATRHIAEKFGFRLIHKDSLCVYELVFQQYDYKKYTSGKLA